MSERAAIVTGAGSGIGAAIARELAVRGCRVAVADIDAAAADRVAGEIGGVPLEADVTSRASIQAAAAHAVERLGGLDVWVSNAGVSRMAPFLDVTEENLDRTLAVNLKGVFHCGQVAARIMRDQGRGGVIVNVASMAGKQGRVPYLAHYVASKFAVVGLTQAMAFELAADGIRVNSVCPGFVATPMQTREIEWEAGLRGSTPEAVRAAWIADTPLGRLEQPEDVANVVAFLLSEDAAFITGEAIAVNGGAYMD
jgi:meso-butanediol dehydrogenase / (S,S)-butanediol dehydrogenase / diacetyl reductase